jgi:hypothetical protein
MHIPHDERAKFSPKARKCVFVGYCVYQKGFRLWDPVQRKFFVSRNVIFNEVIPVSPNSTDDGSQKGDEIDLCSPVEDYPTEDSSHIPFIAQDPDLCSPVEDYPASHIPCIAQDSVTIGADLCSPVEVTPPIPDDLPLSTVSRTASILGPRSRRPPVRWADESLTGIYAGLAVDPDELIEPLTYEDAISSPQAAQWKAAMEDEINSLLQNETWVLVENPSGRKPIQNRWVYKIKRDSHGGIKFKARLVAKGFSQRPGIDYNETYSPVVKHDSIRTILSLSAVLDLELLQLDVKTAFLNGEITEELYMDQPSGFKEDNQKVCLLKKSLYGLKQASRAWNLKFNHFLVEYGFTRSGADSCVYFQKDENHTTIIAIWVDDGLLCSSHQTKLDEIVKYLSDQFEITSGPVDHFVGLEISRDRPKKLIHVSQQSYVKKILARFGVEDCKPRNIPGDPFSHF